MSEDLYVFTPSSEFTFPISAGDDLIHRLLRPLCPYLITAGSAEMVGQLIEQGYCVGTLQPAPPASDEASGGPLLYVDADPGDAVWSWRQAAGNGAAVMLAGDSSLLPSHAVAHDYPVPLQVASAYRPWKLVRPRQAGWLKPADEPLLKPTLRFGWVEAARSATRLVRSDSPLVLLLPNAPGHYRSWPGSHVFLTAMALHERGATVLLWTSCRRRLVTRVGEQEARLDGDPAFDLSGVLRTPGEVAALISLVDVVISAESGMVPLSLSLGKPCVALCGPTRPPLRLPPAALVLAPDDPCSPCTPADDRPPCDLPWCEAITRVDPEAVADAAIQLTQEARISG